MRPFLKSVLCYLQQTARNGRRIRAKIRRRALRQIFRIPAVTGIQILRIDITFRRRTARKIIQKIIRGNQRDGTDNSKKTIAYGPVRHILQ